MRAFMVNIVSMVYFYSIFHLTACVFAREALRWVGRREEMDWDRKRDSSLLLVAIEKKNYKVIEALIMKGATVTEAALNLAKKSGVKKLVELLRDVKSAADKGPVTTDEKLQGDLSAAINKIEVATWDVNKTIALIQSTKESGIDINTPCGNTYTGPGFWNKQRTLTPLVLAIHKGNVKIVTALLENGAKVTASDVAIATDPVITDLLENKLRENRCKNSFW